MTWPTRRGDEPTIRARYPHDADRLRRMLTAGDPLADAALAELRPLGGHGRRLLARGLREGLATLTDPPPGLAALLTEVEAAAAEADHDDLDRGSAAYLSAPYFAHVIALGQGSLFNTYSAPSIAAVLVRTGRLITTAGRRLAETGKWSTQTMLPGGLRRGAGGYTATVMVRILHAQVRAATSDSDWDAAAWGSPINQVDQARTWLDLNYVPYRALTAMGYDFTADELSSVYSRWRLTARLLGVDPGFYSTVDGHESAAAVSDLIETTIGEPDDSCRRLVASMGAASAEMMSPLLGTPPATTDSLLRAHIELIHGPERARALDVAPSDLQGLMPLLVNSARENRGLQRMLPEVWQQHQQRNRATIEGFLAEQSGDTAVYESVARH